MAISSGTDDPRNGLIVFFNADKLPVTYVPQTGGHADYASAVAQLHPIQRSGADHVVKRSTFDSATGTFKIPPRTTAVFVVGDPGQN